MLATWILSLEPPERVFLFGSSLLIFDRGRRTSGNGFSRFYMKSVTRHLNLMPTVWSLLYHSLLGGSDCGHMLEGPKRMLILTEELDDISFGNLVGLRAYIVK